MKSLTDLYIFRHGETDWNLYGKVQGHSDIPLNSRGRDQARGLGRILKNLSFDVVLSSDLSRALETAKIAMETEKNIEIRLSKQLRERCCGSFEGRTRAEIESQYGENFWRNLTSHGILEPEHPDPLFETNETLGLRLRKFVEGFVAENKPHALAISTHGGCLRNFARICQNAPAENIPIPNGALYHFQYQEGGVWTLLGKL
jgi:probable phosphoglycerate mutase